MNTFNICIEIRIFMNIPSNENCWVESLRLNLSTHFYAVDNYKAVPHRNDVLLLN